MCPEAGLSKAMGGHVEDPEVFSARILHYTKAGCSTSWAVIAAPRFISMPLLKPDSGFQWFWERCNLMGSAKFKKLIDAYR